MKKNEWAHEELTERIKKGLDLAFKKLVAEKKRIMAHLFFLKTASLKK